MKHIQKIFAVGVAVASLFAFVACKQDVDNSVATYSYTEGPNENTFEEGTYTYTYSGSMAYTVTFYNDNTWVCHYKQTQKYTQGDIVYLTEYDLDGYAGTYTGDPTTDGEIEMITTKKVDSSQISEISQIDYSKQESQTIKITNADAPLKDLTSEEQEASKETITITDGELAYTKGGFTVTRQ